MWESVIADAGAMAVMACPAPPLMLSSRTHRGCDPESSTAKDSQNLPRHCRTGSPGRGSASPEDDNSQGIARLDPSRRLSIRTGRVRHVVVNLNRSGLDVGFRLVD